MQHESGQELTDNTKENDTKKMQVFKAIFALIHRKVNDVVYSRRLIINNDKMVPVVKKEQNWLK